MRLPAVILPYQCFASTNPVAASRQTVAGAMITLDGWVSDPTATVALSWLDASDTANSLGAEIERDGHFWSDELPLAAGANNWTISATDSWGNTSVTNFVVNKGSLALAIEQPGDDQLFAPKTDVSGQVGNSSYIVKVDGVTAQVAGDGTWVAHDVPVNQASVGSHFLHKRRIEEFVVAVVGGGAAVNVPPWSKTYDDHTNDPHLTDDTFPEWEFIFPLAQ